MRRMYSEQELSVIVYQVMGQYIQDGAFNQTINDYIDAYLVEHPIDPTAITGLDIAPKNITSSGNITAPSIIENMSGYSFTKNTTTNITLTYAYAGCVKNGNKLTLAVYGNIKASDTISGGVIIGTFNVPSAIGSKIYPIEHAESINHVDNKVITLFSTNNSFISVPCRLIKLSDTQFQFVINGASFVTSTNYVFRYEVTFLLSDNLAS